MFGARAGRTGAIVLGVKDDAGTRRAVREAAELAVLEDKALHLVAVHDLKDSYVHRAQRSVGPSDVAHMMSPRGDAEAFIADLAELVAATGVTIVAHVHQGSLRAAVRATTKALAAAPAPAPVRSAVPAPLAPAPVPAPAAPSPAAPAAGGRFRREPAVTAEEAPLPLAAG